MTNAPAFPRLFALCAFALLPILGPVVPVRAVDSVPAIKSFDIPADSADKSLRQFSLQAGCDVLFATQIANKVRSNPIKGDYTPVDAVKMLLAGTGLTATQNRKTGSFTVSRANDPNAQRVALETSSHPSTANTIDEGRRNEDETQMMGKYEVKDRRPFTDANVDLVRTMDDAQPYYVFKGDTIEKSGATNVEDFLKQQLTMDTTARTNAQTFASTFTTTSSVNLRGLGTNQTLILINGRRVPSFSILGSSIQPDVNGIPVGAIDRVEVLPDSSAAIYGSGAVGGAINIVLKKDYTGGEIKLRYENATNTDAPIRTADVNLGLSLEGGKTHVMISGHFQDAAFLLSRDRPETTSARGVSLILKNNPNLLESVGTPFLGATPNISTGNSAVNLTLKNGVSLNSPITYVPLGTSSATPAAILNAGLLSNAGAYNLNLPNSPTFATGQLLGLGTVPKVRAIYTNVQRDMTSWLKAFVTFTYNDNIGSGIASSALAGVRTVPASAPTNPFNQTVLVAMPNSLSPIGQSQSTATGATIGFTAALPKDWSLEADYTWSAERYGGKNPARGSQGDSTALTAALANGTINPFTDTLATSLDLTRFQGASLYTTKTTLNDLGIRSAGPVFTLPGGAVQFTAGLEHRKEGNGDYPFSVIYPDYPADDILREYYGQAQTTDSCYAEINVPLVSKGNSRVGIQLLDFQLAGRAEDVSVGSSTGFLSLTSTPAVIAASFAHSKTHYTAKNKSVGGRYSPVKGITLRASYSSGTTPPTYTQLAPNPVPFTAIVIDPLNGNTSTSVPEVTGGNPSLKPEDSTATSAGIIFEPEALKGLRVGVDWFQIKKRNQIITLPVQTVVSDVASGVLPSYLVTRDPASTRITLVSDIPLNLTKAEVDGIDVSLEYNTPVTEIGKFDLFALGTVAQHFKQQAAFGAPYLDEVGQVSFAGAPVHFKGNATLRWDYHAWSLSWTAEYYSSYAQQGPPVTANTSFILAQGSDRIPSQIYHNIAVSYSFGDQMDRRLKLLGNLAIQVGVKNVFNAIPPFDASQAPYYYSPFGDARLRNYWVALSTKW